MSKRGSIFWGLTVLALVWSTRAGAAPRWLRLSWTQDPSQSITVSWTDGPGTGSAEIQLPDNSTRSVDAVTVDTGSSELETTYTVTFTGLEPDTAYRYRVQSGGQWSDWYDARTGPAPGSCSAFTFVMGGDSRGEELLGHYRQVQWPAIVGLIAAENPLFMLHSGDYVRSGGDDSQWAAELDVLPELSQSHSFFVTLGNHDTGPGRGESSWYDMVFAYPNDNPDSVEDYYTFVTGNLQVVCLSTETYDMDAQIAWLDQVLTAHESQVDWKVVFFHRPVWSSGEHGSNEDDKPRAEILLPVLEAHHVDIVLNGHDHDYERFHPSLGGYGTPRQINPLPDDNGRRGVANGVVYIVSGGAGALVNPIFSQTIEGSAFGSNHLHYIVAQVAGSTMTLTVRDLGSQGFSDPSIQGELETVVLEKSGGLCGGSHPDGGTDAGVDAGWDGGTDGGTALDGQGQPDDSATAADGGLQADGNSGLDSGEGGSGTAKSGCNCRNAGGTPTLPVLFALILCLTWLRFRKKARSRTVPR